MTAYQAAEFTPRKGEKPHHDGKYYRTILGRKVGFSKGENVEEAKAKKGVGREAKKERRAGRINAKYDEKDNNRKIKTAKYQIEKYEGRLEEAIAEGDEDAVKRYKQYIKEDKKNLRDAEDERDSGIHKGITGLGKDSKKGDKKRRLAESDKKADGRPKSSDKDIDEFARSHGFNKEDTEKLRDRVKSGENRYSSRLEEAKAHLKKAEKSYRENPSDSTKDFIDKYKKEIRGLEGRSKPTLNDPPAEPGLGSKIDAQNDITRIMENTGYDSTNTDKQKIRALKRERKGTTGKIREMYDKALDELGGTSGVDDIISNAMSPTKADGTHKTTPDKMKELRSALRSAESQEDKDAISNTIKGLQSKIKSEGWMTGSEKARAAENRIRANEENLTRAIQEGNEGDIAKYRKMIKDDMKGSRIKPRTSLSNPPVSPGVDPETAKRNQREYDKRVAEGRKAYEKEEARKISEIADKYDHYDESELNERLESIGYDLSNDSIDEDEARLEVRGIQSVMADNDYEEDVNTAYGYSLPNWWSDGPSKTKDHGYGGTGNSIKKSEDKLTDAVQKNDAAKIDSARKELKADSAYTKANEQYLKDGTGGSGNKSVDDFDSAIYQYEKAKKDHKAGKISDSKLKSSLDRAKRAGSRAKLPAERPGESPPKGGGESDVPKNSSDIYADREGTRGKGNRIRDYRKMAEDARAEYARAKAGGNEAEMRAAEGRYEAIESIMKSRGYDPTYLNPRDKGPFPDDKGSPMMRKAFKERADRIRRDMAKVDEKNDPVRANTLKNRYDDLVAEAKKEGIDRSDLRPSRGARKPDTGKSKSVSNAEDGLTKAVQEGGDVGKAKKALKAAKAAKTPPKTRIDELKRHYKNDDRDELENELGDLRYEYGVVGDKSSENEDRINAILAVMDDNGWEDDKSTPYNYDGP